MDGRSSQAERPGLSRFILPIAGLIGLRPVRRRHPRPDRPAGRAEPPRLDLRRARQRGGRRRLCGTGRAINWSPSSCWRRSPWRSASAASGSCSSASARWSACCSRSGATGSCRGSSSAPPWCCLAVFLVYPAAGTVLRSFQDETGALHARQLRGAGRARVRRDPAQQRHLAGRRDRRQRGARPRSSPGSSIASGASRWPRPSSSCRWRSRSSAHRSSGSFVYAWQPRRPAADRAPERDRGRPSAASRSRG